MYQYYSGFLFAIILSYLIVLSNCWMTRAIRKVNDDMILNKIVVSIVENCDLGLQSIIFFGDNNSQSTLKALSKLNILVTKLLMVETLITDAIENLYEVENQGLVLAMNTHSINFLLYNKILFEWRCKKNCSVIIKPKPHDDCDNAASTLFYMGRMSIFNAYYVCIEENIPVVFTYDSYGDTKPFHWIVDSQKTTRFNTFILYNRSFKEGKICEGFVFERTNITHNNSILIAMSKKVFTRSRKNILDDGFYGNEIKKLLTGPAEELNILEKLTNIKFTYYYMGADVNDYAPYVFKVLLADIYFQLSSQSNYKLQRHSFAPTYWSSFAIISHNRGFRTPLEKIGNFYGMWTLSSLIIILMITFIVIWYKMRKNIAFAAFDIIRLLINSGVFVPMDTLSLKIFFCMIFLYFMVIHATFSGNLAKFLTIPEYCKNIDTVEDLADSLVKTVYCISAICRTHENLKSLQEKLILVNDYDICVYEAITNLSIACVAAFEPLRDYVDHNIDDSTLYLSQGFASFQLSYTYRKQFILSEKFNKALMYMNEIDLSSRSSKIKDRNLTEVFKRHRTISEIDFRTVTVEDLKFAFVLLIIGNSLSFVCFIIEMTIEWIRKNFKRRNWVKTFEYNNNNLKIKKLKIITQPRMM